MKAGHQRFVLTDPVAFRYLEEDPSTTVLERRRELKGYECYVVEQWTTSRTHPTMVITTFTGEASHQVVVGVLSVPTDETTWSTRLRVYFKALNHFHATRRQTELGILMVTNLSNFPSSLTVIPVPNGDLRKYRSDFFVNENLKRLGCSGRVGLTLATPAPSTIAKFHRLYRVSEKNDIYQTVIELVKLCQSALMLFDKLEIDYADGLLCDVTERAINDWWVEIGNEQYDVEPQDGILGPTTVAGLLGLLMGSRNRLHAVNAPVAKDAFDVETMKQAIGHFQKQQRMTRTRRLDRKTLERLQKATQKAANNEGFTLPKAVKSTVAELSGKGGEMVMDVVGRRDKAGLAEVETCDIERFVQLVYGEKCKWLWLGKPLKKARDGHQDGMAESGHFSRSLVFQPDDHGGYSWTVRKSTVDGPPAAKVDEYDDTASHLGHSRSASDEEDARPSGVLKRTTGLKQEAKSGIGKLREAVGFIGHHHSKTAPDERPITPTEQSSKAKRPLFRRVQSSPLSSPVSPKSPTLEHVLGAAMHNQHDRMVINSDPSNTMSNLHVPSATEGMGSRTTALPEEAVIDSTAKNTESDEPSEQPSTAVTAEPSVAGSVYTDGEGTEPEPDIDHLLRRTVSLSRFISVNLEHRPSSAYPRHLSFSTAEDSVLDWEDVNAEDRSSHFRTLKVQFADEELIAAEAKRVTLLIDGLNLETAEWTQDQLHSLQKLLNQADDDQRTLESMYEPHNEHVTWLHGNVEGMLRTQKERFDEGEKEIETLAAKLEYEIGGLRSRVEDVQAGVGDFEKGVRRVEERVAELEKAGESKSWGCVVC